ncbi:hypothetical protein JTB14_029545 [Gonioctena quinquepunctata]|nr:hypothetical protein JTB14_029545 [Gonioctena quinquepunctata]
MYESPHFAGILENVIFVDDIVSGSHWLPEALKLQIDLIRILDKGGFELRKWWKCDGIIHHYGYLKLLLMEHNPICVCILESHLKLEQPYSIRDYQISRRDVAPDPRAHGGVLTMVRNDIHLEKVVIQSRLQELGTAIHNLKNSTPGLDDIIKEILRNLTHEMKITSLQIYIDIFQHTTNPKQWKEAIIVSIPKEGKNPNNLSNYRPISLTRCIGKLLKHMISNRLGWYLERNNLLNRFQSGSLRHRSTIDHLIFFEKAVQDSFKDPKHLVAVSSDLTKAHVSTWRYGILQKLHEYRLRGSTIPEITKKLRTTIDEKSGNRNQDIVSPKMKLVEDMSADCGDHNMTLF